MVAQNLVPQGSAEPASDRGCRRAEGPIIVESIFKAKRFTRLGKMSCGGEETFSNARIISNIRSIIQVIAGTIDVTGRSAARRKAFEVGIWGDSSTIP